MLTVLGVHKIEPTRFPDGTTQVWKLPNEILNAGEVRVDWRFEREDELLALAQLRALLSGVKFHLHVPYLPFARQDKLVTNGQTFALAPFATLLNALKCESVTAVDVHNESAAQRLITYFKNVTVENIHEQLIKTLVPDLVVFPDAGARGRYMHLQKHPHLVFEKERDQATGEILGHKLVTRAGNPELLSAGSRLFIVDDICDGGATFLSIAKAVKATHPGVKIDLFVTHGLFSKGREILEKAGISLHTTNSLPRNPTGIPV